MAVLVLTVMLGTQSPGLAARPPIESAAQFLALRSGGTPSDFTVVYERSARAPGGESLRASKLVDRRTGRVALVYRDAHGNTGGPEMLSGLERAAQARLTAFERKAGPSLRRAVADHAASRDNGLLPVAVWLTADVAAAERAVVDRHPEVSWLDGRPMTNRLSLVRTLRGELWLARRDAYAEASAGLQRQVEELGGRVAYASTAAPLVFVDLPAGAVAALAERADVESLGLEGKWQPAMSVSGPVVEANWTSGSSDRGAGIRVAVVEYHNVRRSGDLGGKVVKSHSTSGSLAYTGGGTFDHPTWVAGAIAGQSSGYRGVAPGASIVSSGTGGYRASLAYDRRIIAAADWAIAPSGGDADIVNTSLVQDTATGAEEARRYFDSLVDQDGRLAVSAAGNYVNFNGWQIGSPGTGYNVLTVGGIDDHGTARRSDDRLWYQPGSNGSNWFDRPGDRWNTHGDYNKPNLVAPAVGVRTANGLAATGTSVATPIVAGVAAQLLANEPILAAWPEGARAVLMAGAIRRIPMPNGSRNVDHEGVGMTSAYWTNLIARAGDNQFGGYRLGSLQPGAEPQQQISVRGGDRLRVALAWNSHTSGRSNLSKTDVLRADLDLRVTAPGGSDLGSYTIDNSYEFVEFVMPATGVATIEVLQTRFDGPSETYGLAWAKVRETIPPSASVRVPANGEPWAVPTTLVSASFNEPVLGVNEQRFTLRQASTGQIISADVNYASTTRTATLRPNQPLAIGWYAARLSAAITDRAGNALRATGWSFRVMRATPSAEGSIDRRVTLQKGVHRGYQFDADGRVIASRRVSLPSVSRAAVDRRQVQPGMPGHWLRVASGTLSGYWLRESSAAGLLGTAGAVRLDPDRRVILRAGTHVGRRFSGDSITGSKSYRASGTVRVTASERAVINGSSRLRISSGALAGYWVAESNVAYLPGAVQLTDLDTGRATVESGTRTAYQFYANGTVRSSKSASQSSALGTPVAAWAVVDGRPRFYVLRGRWAGYWLGESPAVHLP
ncbi:MAG TPA: S8 family serine peptidase [Candidatus Limnocylindrales bacterium]|nr:S8 family serine peptidase [Candidatus Limnocylindrales bacterium]